LRAGQGEERIIATGLTAVRIFEASWTEEGYIAKSVGESSTKKLF
jgi:hypothetical protein